MSNDRAFERATRDWLEAGSDRTPAATIDAVLLAARTTPQERDLRISWRTPPMPRTLRFAAMFALVAIVGIGASALLRNGSTVGPGPTPTPSASPTSNPSPTPTGASSLPTPGDSALVAASRDFAAKVGVQLSPTAAPLVEEGNLSFDPSTLRVVTLFRSDSTDANPRVFRVHFDAAGVIRVVETGSAGATGSISREEGIVHASELLQLAGHDPADGTIEVALGQPGQEWYITFSRVIDGYPVSNYPAAWGPDGDKAYVQLRPNGELAELYYVRPATVAHGALPSTAEMDAALSAAMQASGQGPQTPAPGLTVERRILWIRPDLPSFDSLVLSYCETARLTSGWSTMCIDPSTGVLDLRNNAGD